MVLQQASLIHRRPGTPRTVRSNRACEPCQWGTWLPPALPAQPRLCSGLDHCPLLLPMKMWCLCTIEPKQEKESFKNREEENIGKTWKGKGPHGKRWASAFCSSSLSMLSGLPLSIQRPSTLRTSRYRKSKLDSSLEINFKIYLFYSVSKCSTCMYVCAAHTCLVSMEARRGCIISWNWSYRHWVATWALRTDPWSYRRAASTLNHWIWIFS